ncbi:hypothetical protein MLD38_002130 [Melastoma candidum]|uniref:Uncharacterized protein n=1 Tax=Melastoma candidum TaxID=119954 RepID=A0ACB9SEU6_9MYRT|nr:hypothetical protein MLD38_002130 [Melastoma candidum]
MMASSSVKPAVALFLVLSVLLQLAGAIHAEATTTAAVGGSQLVQNLNCGGACVARCRLSKRPNLCKRACGTCCYRCGCVPTGTSGNLDSCPCYASLKTHGGRRKCP